MERNTEWLARQFARLPAHSNQVEPWRIGTKIFFRGELVPLAAETNGEAQFIRCGNELISIRDATADLRPWIVKHLWRLAAAEFPPRVFELAAAHQVGVVRVTIRNQRTRWGSCSRRGTISLNWRLIQTPPFVRDYLILHELMHRRQMNHSERFWREVAGVCPEYRTAERWLKQHATLLK